MSRSIDHWGMEMWKVHVYIVARRVGRQADGHLEGGISLESSVVNDCGLPASTDRSVVTRRYP